MNVKDIMVKIKPFRRLKEIFYESNENEIFEYIKNLANVNEGIFEFDSSDADVEKLEHVYYTAYFIIFSSIKFKNEISHDDLDLYLKKAAESLEYLSKINNSIFDEADLIFDSVITYYLSSNYSQAYVIASEHKDINLPMYKEVIFRFLKKDFHNLRRDILKELSSEELNEEVLIQSLANDEINELEALSMMLSYSIFKSLNNVFNFLYSGDKDFINSSLGLLERYGLLASDYGFVDFWWCISVLRLLIQELYDNSLWNQLDQFNNDNEYNPMLKQYIRNYLERENPIVELWPSQIESLPMINDKQRPNFILKMPTSAGKTFVAELTMLRFFLDNKNRPYKKIVYISPFKSLSNELEISFKNSIGKLGFRISEFYGGFDTNLFENYIFDEIDIFILTPEKFDILLRLNPNFKYDIGLVIIDEGHIIGNFDERAINFEFFMYRLKNLLKNSRFLFISAVLSNPEDFSKWLSDDNDNIVYSKWKPSRSFFGVLEWSNEGAYIESIQSNATKKIKFSNIFNKEEFFNSSRRRSDFPSKNNEALAFSCLKFAQEGTTYVFAPQTKEIIALSDTILNVLKFLNNDMENNSLNLNINKDNPEILKLKQIIREELGETSKLLEYLDNGFLIHYSNLPDRVKIEIENVLRENEINLVIGTNTLAQGVNFPIKTVLFKGLRLGKKDLDSATFFNISGRAGRAYYKNEGRIILFLDNIKNKNNVRHANNKKRKNFYSLINSQYIVNSIFKEFFTRLKKRFRSHDLNFEKLCFSLADAYLKSNEHPDKDIFHYVNLLDNQLLAFSEEFGTELNIHDLLNEIINLSLYNIQVPDKKNSLKNYFESRLNFLNKYYPSEKRRKMYFLGLNLKDCEVIENNSKMLLNLLKSSEDGCDLFDILYELSIFIFNLNSIAKNIKFINKNHFGENDEIIIKFWIKGFTSKEIYDELETKIDLDKINSLINSCKAMIPWGINSILTYFRQDDSNKIPEVCNYFSEMFKYGIFDLNTIKLMLIFHDLDLCKEIISKNIDVSDKNFEKIINDICNLSSDNQLEKSSMEKIHNVLHDDVEHGLSFSFTFKRDIINIFKQYDEVIVDIVDFNLYFYSLDGDKIISFKEQEYNINNYPIFNQTFINKIWKIIFKSKDGLVLEEKN